MYGCRQRRGHHDFFVQCGSMPAIVAGVWWRKNFNTAEGTKSQAECPDKPPSAEVITQPAGQPAEGQACRTPWSVRQTHEVPNTVWVVRSAVSVLIYRRPAVWGAGDRL